MSLFLFQAIHHDIIMAKKKELQVHTCTISNKIELGSGWSSLVRFLDASSHLYNRVYPSVGRSVRPSARQSVGWSVSDAFLKNKGN